MQIEPYLFFEGRCDEAIEFYRRTLGAEVGMLMRYKDSPEPPRPAALPPGSENKVMHASLQHRRYQGDGLRRTLLGAAGLPGIFAVAYACRMRRAPIRCLPLWPMAGKCRCRSPRPSLRRASAWSPTASACCG